MERLASLRYNLWFVNIWNHLNLDICFIVRWSLEIYQGSFSYSSNLLD